MTSPSSLIPRSQRPPEPAPPDPAIDSSARGGSAVRMVQTVKSSVDRHDLDHRNKQVESCRLRRLRKPTVFKPARPANQPARNRPGMRSLQPLVDALIDQNAHLRRKPTNSSFASSSAPPAPAARDRGKSSRKSSSARRFQIFDNVSTGRRFPGNYSHAMLSLLILVIAPVIASTLSPRSPSNARSSSVLITACRLIFNLAAR